MTLMDDRGRLFARWNVIDVAALVGVVVLLVLSYGAVLLFRTPVPVIASITPVQITAMQPVTLSITGEHLRPFLRVRLGPLTAPLAVASPASAEVKIEGLPPGTYDFVLLDEAREVARVRGALEVAAGPTTRIEMHAVGTFVLLTAQDAGYIRPGMRLDAALPPAGSPAEFGPASRSERPRATARHAQTEMDDRLTVAHVLEARPPETGTVQVQVGDGPNAMVTSPVPNTWQVPAIIRLRCAVAGNQCRIGDANVAQGTLIPLAVPAGPGDLSRRRGRNLLFRVERLAPIEAQVAFPSVVTADAVVRVKFLARPEVAGLPKPGDEDFSILGAGGPEDTRHNGRTLRAAIVTLNTVSEAVVATTEVGPTSFQETMATFEATLKVPVVLTSAGWQYGDRQVKMGAPFRFEGRTYAMDGWVIALRLGNGAGTGNR